MGYIEDIAEEYRHWEHTETVTFTARRNAGNTTDVITGGAKRLPLTKARDFFSQVMLAGDERIWLLADAVLVNATEVVPGDSIMEGTASGGTTWTVKHVQRVRFDSQWVCLCVKQR